MAAAAAGTSGWAAYMAADEPVAPAGLTALLLGATGATGKHVLREVLSSERWTHVGEYGRSVTAEAKLPENHSKLEQKIIDFEKLDVAGLKDGNWDVVFITLGTTKAKAGSAAAFERIDREYVLNAARTAKSDDPTRKQRLVYVSSAGSSPKSMFLYPRSKGLTEQGLAGLGYDDVIIFRPAVLAQAERPDTGLLETLVVAAIGFLSRFSSSLQIPVSTLGRSIRIAGELGSAGIPDNLKSSETMNGNSITVVNNAQAIQLAAHQ